MKVSSSNILDVAWDTENNLTVIFKNGDTWLYHELPDEKIMPLKTPPTEDFSYGKYFNAEIRGQFAGSKVDTICATCGDRIEGKDLSGKRLSFHYYVFNGQVYARHEGCEAPNIAEETV